MDKIEYDEDVYIDNDDTLYKDIIENDYYFNETVRYGKISKLYVSQSIDDFYVGIINISKRISHRKKNIDLIRSITKLTAPEESSPEISSSSENDDDVIYRRIQINGYIICDEGTVEGEKSFEIKVLCVRRGCKGMAKRFMDQIIEYCINDGIRIITLITVQFYLVEYFERFGFKVTDNNNEIDNQHGTLRMKRENWNKYG